MVKKNNAIWYLRRSRGRGECVSNVCRIFLYLYNKKAMYGIVWARILNFKDHKHQFQRIISSWEIKSVVELLVLGDIDSMRKHWRFKSPNLKHSRSPEIDSKDPIPPSWESILSSLKGLQTSSDLSSSYVVCGEGHPYIDQHISNMQTIWRLSAGDEKAILAVKFNIYGTWPTWFHTWFLVPTKSKNTGFEVVL
jgi:hypothetical protein